MQVHETILCSTAPSAEASFKALGSGALSLYDIQTGSCLASFKQTSAGARCVAALPTVGDAGGVMFAAQADKSVINVYNFQKDQVAIKMVLPEKLTCVALDRQGAYFAGGTVQGRIYLWEVASGILFNVWDAHYRRVSVLRFTDDGAALISGSEDAGVSVWSLASLLDNTTKSEIPTPLSTLADHTLSITDIQIGAGKFPACRVLTASLDHTVKIWDLNTASLLTTFHLPFPPEHVVFDPTERAFFATAGADVYQVNLYAPRAGGAPHEMDAVGGKGSGDTQRIEDFPNARKRKISIGAPISSIALSLTSSQLLIGTSRSQIHIYDVRSHQLLRTINIGTPPASGAPAHAITHISTMLRPSDLVGHVRLGGGGESSVIARHVVPFHRTRDAKAREAHEVGMMLPSRAQPKCERAYDREEMLRDHAFFTKPDKGIEFLSGTPGSTPSNARVEELEREVTLLREQLGKAKGINDAMWEAVVRKVSNSTRTGSDSTSDEGPRKKRGKV